MNLRMNRKNEGGFAFAQGRRKRGAGGGFSPPVFGQTVNPISTRGADYTYHSTTSPPGISDLAKGLYMGVLSLVQIQLDGSDMAWTSKVLVILIIATAVAEKLSLPPAKILKAFVIK